MNEDQQAVALSSVKTASPSITDRLSGIIDHANLLGQRAGMVGNRLFGSVPTPDEQNKAPVPDNIDAQVGVLNYSLKRLDEEITRLEQI